ncbi:MAG: ribonuclease E/G [Boseongicola sp.]
MKGTLAVFDQINGKGAAAFLRDGQLDDLLIDPPDDRIRPGAIFRAKAGRPMKGQGGMMLDTPQGRVYLRQAKGIAQGQGMFVQATTFAEHGKATPVSSRIVFKSRFALATPGAPGHNISREIKDEERRIALRGLTDGLTKNDIGVVIRSAASDADDDAVKADAVAVLDLARKVMREALTGAPELLLDGPDAAEVAQREWSTPDTSDDAAGAFERHGVSEMIAAQTHPRADLPGSGFVFVEPTRALVAVDVNTGRDTSPAACLKANIAAMRTLPKLLRVRGLGGQIVLDLAPFPKKERRQVEQAFRTAFRRDPIETSLVGWTPLGHLELSRKRERLPLSEAIS